MYRIVTEKPANLSIEIVDCINRGGRHYSHPFIGPFALSTAMMAALKTMGVNAYECRRIPDSFFDTYQLMECEYHPENPKDEQFVTSNYWYTCKALFPLDKLDSEQKRI